VATAASVLSGDELLREILLRLGLLIVLVRATTV
jgi:hypothetical protein